jgi:hypothetical protein
MRFRVACCIAAIVAVASISAIGAEPDLSKLKINEIMSGGGSGDYVEIYNAGDSMIELVPMELRDWSSGESNTYAFCLGRIQPHGLWAVNCPYLLNASGEEVSLCTPDGTVIDSVAFPPAPIGYYVSYGRVPDGADTMAFCDPSLMIPNAVAREGEPMVTDLRYSPVRPQLGDPVLMTFRIVSPKTPAKVELYYMPGPATGIEALDDGLHGDGQPGDGTYGATIPPLPAPGLMRYFLRIDGAVPSVLVQDQLAFNYGYVGPPIRINEILAMNRRTGSWEPGSAGPFADYIELYNAGAERVNVSQLKFRQAFWGYAYPIHSGSDDGGPLWLDPGAHLLVWASKDSFGLAPVGVEMSLSHNGEDVILLAPDDVSVIDAVRYPPLYADTVYARSPEGTGDFQVGVPTPEGGEIYPPGFMAFVGAAVAAPLPADPIPIRVWVSPEVESPTVVVRYKIGEVQGTEPLFNDGGHDDDLAGDEIFGGTIPPVGVVGELQFAFELTTGGVTSRDPFLPDQWHTLPIGLKPKGRLVINEVLAARFDESGVCPSTWPPPGGEGSLQDGKFVEIYNNGMTLEDFHFVITGSMFNYNRGVEFKRGHVANLGTVAAFPWDRLDFHGGTLFLRGVETGTLYDAVTYPQMEPGQSYGRSPDGGPWRILDEPSPGKLNGPFPFTRGDANGDRDIDLSDPISALLYLYAGGDTDCKDSLDVDDNGTLEITDPIYVLTFLFLGGPGPYPPYPATGSDPTEDDIGCKRVPPVEGQ